MWHRIYNAYNACLFTFVYLILKFLVCPVVYYHIMASKGLFLNYSSLFAHHLTICLVVTSYNLSLVNVIIAMLAPLGKSDHSVLSIDCTLQTDVVQKVVKYNYNKGDYEGMRQRVQINWNKLFLPLDNDIVTMWLTFKQELQHRTLQFISVMRNTWKNEGWTRPLNSKLREYISKNIDSGLDIWRPVIMLYFKNINQSVIKLEMKFVNYKKRNNKMSLSIANKIQRPFGSILITNVKLKLAMVI